jgi:hypothetical protein
MPPRFSLLYPKSVSDCYYDEGQKKKEEHAVSYSMLREKSGRKRKEKEDEADDRNKEVENVVVGYDM